MNQSDGLKPKCLTLAVLFQSNKMGKKDIFIFAAMLVLVGINLYLRYMKKKKANAGGVFGNKAREKSSLSVQPDDYEPYSGKKQPE